MTARRLRLAAVALVVIGAIAWLGSARVLDSGVGGFGFGSLAMGDPGYVLVAVADGDATIRWADIEVVGPVEARLVLCPEATAGGATYDCPGGPLEAIGSRLERHEEWDAPIGPSALFVEVRRVDPGSAAVCNTRVLHSSGVRAGLQGLATTVRLPALDAEPDEAAHYDPALDLCG